LVGFAGTASLGYDAMKPVMAKLSSGERDSIGDVRMQSVIRKEMGMSFDRVKFKGDLTGFGLASKTRDRSSSN
jgi:hypothetical protein